MDNPYYGAMGTVLGCVKGEIRVEFEGELEDKEENLGVSTVALTVT